MGSQLPKMELEPIPLETLCSDEGVVKDYLSDPLVYKGGMRTRVAAEFLQNFDYVKANAPNWTLPVFVMHGKLDKLTNPDGSSAFFEAIGTPEADKKFTLYPNLKHELFNEEQGRDAKGVNQPLRDTVEWLRSRL